MTTISTNGGIIHFYLNLITDIYYTLHNHIAIIWMTTLQSSFLNHLIATREKGVKVKQT